MGFNPNSPTLRGGEWQPTAARQVRLDSPNRAIAMRVRPGAVTVARVHTLLAAVQGNPGLAVELVTSLDPAITETEFFPGTDTNSHVTSWQDQGASTANYTEIDDRYGTADYHQNIAANGRFQGMPLWFSGNDAGGLAGQRILSVRIGCHFHNRALAGNDPTVNLQALLRIDAATYLGRTATPRKQATTNTFPNLGVWDLNPLTGLPWTLAQADDLIDAADADAFGVKVTGKVAAAGFRIHGLFLTVRHCTENRAGFLHSGGAPRGGWNENALGSTAAMSANTSYYLVVSCPTASAADSVTVPALGDTNLIVDDLAAGTGDHRVAYDLTLDTPGGVATATARRSEMIPALLDTGSINAESQPYSAVTPVAVHSTQDTIGQQITTAAATTYAGVRLLVARQDARRAPGRPLVIEMRSGGGAISGAGTLHATATVDPDAVTDGNPVQVTAAFDTAFAAGATTQYHLVVTSQATDGNGWSVRVLDTASNVVNGTTTNEVEGATVGGQTDSWFRAGTAFDRYDLPLALIAAPTAPANPTATATEGA